MKIKHKNSIMTQYAAFRSDFQKVFNVAEEATVTFLIGSLGTPAVGLLTSATTAYMSASKAKRDFERCTKYAQEDYGKNS